MDTIKNWLFQPVICSREHIGVVKTGTMLKYVIQKSKRFRPVFPMDSMRNQTLVKYVQEEVLDRNIKSAYPIIHERVLKLCAEFLTFKSTHGNQIEKNVYKDMSILEFIQRLLEKRAVMFIVQNEHYILRDGTEGLGGWANIGTENERKPLTLKDYLSYDENKISALLSVSSYSYFINEGSRNNNAILKEDRSEIEEEGIIIGLIGTTLTKPRVLEYQEIVISEHQNTIEKGYGNNAEDNIRNVFFNFYEESSLLYNKIPKNCGNRFIRLQNGAIFDNIMYAKRLAISFDTLLIEANSRAQEREKFAYIHVVGIGLGVWRISSHQEGVFVETFGQRIRALGSKLCHISDIHFSYFGNTTRCLEYTNEQIFTIPDHSKGGIKIHISNRNPYNKLHDAGKLLVVSWAWDGNSLPGNEFWIGCLGNSGDSSTASSSQVTELLNPFINKMVCAENLMVATCNGVIPYKKYVEENVHLNLTNAALD